MFINEKKHEIVRIKGLRIIPFVSIRYLIIVVVAAAIILFIADRSIPQYAAWKTEDKKVQLEKYLHHVHNVTHNDYGYPLWQIDDYPLDIDAVEGKRILVIGDSFIWGDGCSNSNYLWWRRLQRLISESGYDNCSIVAVGKCGASTQDELEWLTNTSLISDVKPDMIIIGYVTNDPQYMDKDGNIVPHQAEIVDYFADGVGRRFANLFPNLSYFLNNTINDKVNSMKKFNYETGFPYYQWELENIRGNNLSRYRDEIVNPLGEFAQKTDIPIVLVATPSIPSEEYYNERYNSVLPLFENVGIKTYNPLKQFINKYKADKHYADGINIVNSHPGTANNLLIAEYVYSILENEYEDCLGDKTDKLDSDNKAKVNDWYPHDLLPNQITNNTIAFKYPGSIDESRYLYMPVKENYVKICFSAPIDIKSLSLKSEDETVENGKIWVTMEDSVKGYDTQDFIFIGDITTDGSIVDVGYEGITQICIHIDLKEETNRKLMLVLDNLG